MQFSLTPKQSELLRFIEDYLGFQGGAPSYEEMRIYMGLQSKSGIHRLVNELRDRGYITWLPHAARSITLIPQSCAGCPRREE